MLFFLTCSITLLILILILSLSVGRTDGKKKQKLEDDCMHTGQTTA